MFFLILKSLMFGVGFGFLYGVMFVGKLKNLYLVYLTKQDKQASKNDSTHKIIFRFASFFFLIHILLISIFAYAIFKFKLDIATLVITFLVSFWSCTLFTIKNPSRRQPLLKLWKAPQDERRGRNRK